MNNTREAIVVMSVTAVLFFVSGACTFGDTIIKKDRERIKGVIVEEYSDRVVMSTIDGEQKIMKSDIQKIDYDLEEQNLTSMGDLYQDRARYQEAYYFYDQALKINPNYKSAKEGLDYSGAMMQQFSRKMKLEHIGKMNDEKAWRTGIKPQEENSEEKLMKVLGFSIEPHGANFKVSEVRLSSPSAVAGLKEGDVIVAVWGRMVGYSQVEDIRSRIVSSEMMEVRLTIVREVEINLTASSGNVYSLIGADIVYSETEGFEVKVVTPGGAFDKAGIISGDVITEIAGESTRYMPLKDMEKYFADNRGSALTISFRREMSLWKKFEKK